MNAARDRLENVRLAFARLSAREQLMVAGGGAAGGLVLLLLLGLLVSAATRRAEHRVRVKSNTLTQVLLLQGEYKARQREQKERVRQLRRRSHVRLVKLVEDAARNAGVNDKISQLTPEKGEANEDGILESRVQLRASGLSIDRLQDFLSRLESTGSLVILRRLKITRPYRKDTLDIDLMVTTFKLKS